MRVLVLENKTLIEKEIGNELEDLQEIVGGWIEIPYLSRRLADEGIDIIINEEGKLMGLEPQIVVADRETNKVLDLVVGNCIFASHDEMGETVGLTNRQIEIVKEELELETIVHGILLKVLYL